MLGDVAAAASAADQATLAKAVNVTLDADVAARGIAEHYATDPGYAPKVRRSFNSRTDRTWQAPWWGSQRVGG